MTRGYLRHRSKIRNLEIRLQRAERTAMESEARYRALFDAAGDGMLILRGERFVSMNAAAQRLLGMILPDNRCELSPAELSPPLQPDGQDSALKAQAMIDLACRNGSHRFRWEHRRMDGETFQVEVALLRIDPGRCPALLVVWHDLSFERQIQRLSDYDQLTNLPNANLLRTRLTDALQRPRAARHRIAVLTLDLDDFKHVMDTHRHEVWEQILRTVAIRLLAAAPYDALVARIGGDVFAIVLERVRDRDWIARQVRELQERLREPLELMEREQLCISSCVGVALYPDDAEDAVDLLRNAGSALHAAKKHGPGAIAFYAPEMTAAAARRLRLPQQLRQALQDHAFELHYQPKVDLATARIVGCEALIRWRHPDGHLVMPGEFIHAVETTDLVHPVGHWVLNRALQQLVEWTAAGLPPLSVSINIAGPQFRRGNLPSEIAAALAATGIEPSRLQIEVVESLLLDDPVHTRGQLAAIRELGVAVALDDFGTGYSSLSYLSRFPVDELKIDRSFVANLVEDISNLTIVRSTVAMAHSLGIRVVAEGVEDDTQLGLLSRLGCDLVQGYHTGRPQPPDAFARLAAADPAAVLPPMLMELTTQGVLIVEDDEVQRQLFSAQLANQGWKIFAVGRADAVWEILATQPIYLLLADYGLPDMDGILLLEQVRQRYSDVVRIMLSASSEALIPAEAINRGGVFRYLTKPCRTEQLREAVREGIELARILRETQYAAIPRIATAPLGR